MSCLLPLSVAGWQVLQDSLCGSSKVLLVTNLAPEAASAAETLSSPVLRRARRQGAPCAGAHACSGMHDPMTAHSPRKSSSSVAQIYNGCMEISSERCMLLVMALNACNTRSHHAINWAEQVWVNQGRSRPHKYLVHVSSLFDSSVYA